MATPRLLALLWGWSHPNVGSVFQLLRSAGARAGRAWPGRGEQWVVSCPEAPAACPQITCWKSGGERPETHQNHTQPRDHSLRLLPAQLSSQSNLCCPPWRSHGKACTETHSCPCTPLHLPPKPHCCWAASHGWDGWLRASPTQNDPSEQEYQVGSTSLCTGMASQAPALPCLLPPDTPATPLHCPGQLPISLAHGPSPSHSHIDFKAITLQLH